MAVLLGTLGGEAAKARALSRTSGGAALPQSPRSFTAPPFLFGRPTKTAMLRRPISLKKPTIWGKTRDENDVRRYP